MGCVQLYFVCDGDCDRKVTLVTFVACDNLSDVNIEYFQKNGFSTPILVRDKAGLGMK